MLVGGAISFMKVVAMLILNLSCYSGFYHFPFFSNKIFVHYNGYFFDCPNFFGCVSTFLRILHFSSFVLAKRAVFLDIFPQISRTNERSFNSDSSFSQASNLTSFKIQLSNLCFVLKKEKSFREDNIYSIRTYINMYYA